MENDKILDEIYTNLQNRKVYGYVVNKVRYPYFCEVLYKTMKGYIGWHNYGSSANKNTKEDLKFIIKKIFLLTPKEFVEKYECRNIEDIYEV